MMGVCDFLLFEILTLVVILLLRNLLILLLLGHCKQTFNLLFPLFYAFLSIHIIIVIVRLVCIKASFRLVPRAVLRADFLDLQVLL